MERLLDGRVALVTGAARGQGRAEALAREGADIIAIDVAQDLPGVTYPLATARDMDETGRLVEELDRRILAAAVDVRDRPSLRTAVDAGAGQFGRLDIIVANAGICMCSDWDQTTVGEWETTIGVNLTGEWNTLQRRTGGCVI